MVSSRSCWLLRSGTVAGEIGGEGLGEGVLSSDVLGSIQAQGISESKL